MIFFEGKNIHFISLRFPLKADSGKRSKTLDVSVGKSMSSYFAVLTQERNALGGGKSEMYSRQSQNVNMMMYLQNHEICRQKSKEASISTQEYRFSLFILFSSVFSFLIRPFFKEII